MNDTIQELRDDETYTPTAGDIHRMVVFLDRVYAILMEIDTAPSDMFATMQDYAGRWMSQQAPSGCHVVEFDSHAAVYDVWFAAHFDRGA